MSPRRNVTVVSEPSDTADGTHLPGGGEEGEGKQAELLAALRAAAPLAERVPGMTPTSGPVMDLYRAGEDGFSELAWRIVPPGTRIEPDLDVRRLASWRVQCHATLAWAAVTLADVTTAVPGERAWARDTHRRVLERLVDRLAGRSSELREQLEEELRAEEASIALAPEPGRRRRWSLRGSRRRSPVRVTAIRPSLRPQALVAGGEQQLRVGQELVDPIVVQLATTDDGTSAEVEVDLKRSVVTFWPRSGEVLVQGKALASVHRIHVSRTAGEWDLLLRDLIEQVVLVT
jgi:hypothetical protein